jgi:hypothetical protein
MADVPAKCAACGAPLVIRVADALADAEVVSAVCQTCTDRQFFERGGVVFNLQEELAGARFALGKITVTPGAVQALSDAGQHPITFLQRHVAGDWGLIGHLDQTELTEDEQRRGWEATDNSAKINKWNLQRGSNIILSEYTTSRGTRHAAVGDDLLDGGDDGVTPGRKLSAAGSS